MLINYDLQKINAVLHDFYKATGVRIDLFGNDFIPISSSHHEICNYCQYIQNDSSCKNACVTFDESLLTRSKHSKATEQDVCPFGLTNIVSPIIWNEQIIGYLFFGQMKMTTEFPDTAEYETNPYLEKMALYEHYSSLSLFDAEKAKSISNLAKMLIAQIITEDMLKPDFDEILQSTVTFINENLEKDLSIKYISQKINVSKNVLYTKFHAKFNCTIGEYINKKRIEKSVDYLTKSALSIEEISQRCGFSSASYYTKMFKTQMGVTPLKFKKSQKL